MKLLKNLFLFRSVTARNKASILVISIWMLVIFSIFAVGLSKICISQINVAKRVQASDLSFSAVFGLCNLLQWELAKDMTIYDTLYEFEHLIAAERVEELGSVSMEYILIDEESKININVMSQSIIKRLPGVDDDIAVEITTSPLRPYNEKEELLLLDSIDEEVFFEISPFITVKSNGQININTAGSEVFEALGLEAGLIEDMISFRKGPDGQEAPVDDVAFKSKDKILEIVDEEIELSDQQRQQFLIALGWFGVKSANFSLTTQTEVLGRKAFEYDIIMTTNKILRWKEE